MSTLRLSTGYAILGILATMISQGAVITVGVSGEDYTTIQAALNTAVAGDTIQVSDGIYIENISPPTGGSATNPITLISSNPLGSTIRRASNLENAVTIDVPDRKSVV